MMYTAWIMILWAVYLCLIMRFILKITKTYKNNIPKKN